MMNGLEKIIYIYFHDYRLHLLIEYGRNQYPRESIFVNGMYGRNNALVVWIGESYEVCPRAKSPDNNLWRSCIKYPFFALVGFLDINGEITLACLFSCIWQLLFEEIGDKANVKLI